MQKPNRANIVVTKFNAAGRQLDAAIRLFFSDEDVLAVHTLGTAAYRILRDLQKGRGVFHFPDVLRVGLWGFAEDYRAGRLTEPLDPKLLPLVQHVASLQASGSIKSAKDIVLNNEHVLEIDDLRKSTKAANFLKHADRDQAASLSENDIDNIDMLFRACAAYKALLHSLTPEMAALVIYAWDEATFGPKASDPVLAQSIAKIKPFSPRKRKLLCRKLIRNAEFRRYFGA